MKARVGAFNQEKALEGALFVVIKLRVIFGNLHLKLYLQPPLGGEADRHVADGGVLRLALGGYTHCRGVS